MQWNTTLGYLAAAAADAALPLPCSSDLSVEVLHSVDRDTQEHSSTLYFYAPLGSTLGELYAVDWGVGQHVCLCTLCAVQSCSWM